MPLGTILLGSCQWHGHVVRHLVPGFVITGSPMCLPWRWTISGYLVSQAFSNKHSYNIYQINFASLSALARLWAACTRHSNQCAINSVATQMANRPLQQVVPSLLLVSPLLLLVSSQSNNLSKNIHIPQIKSNLEGSSDSDFPKSQSFSIHWFHGYSMDIPWIPMGKPWEAMGSHRGALASILLGRRLWRRTSGALRGPVGSAWASQFLYRNVYLVFFCKRSI